MKRKLVSVVVASCMVITMLAGCGKTSSSASSGGSSNASTDYKMAEGAGTVVVGISEDPQNLGPWSGMTGGRVSMLFSLYEYLVTLQDGNYVGVLAKNWTKVDDTTYQVTIYDYIKDSAGNELKASDIVYSFETAIETKNYGKLNSIESVTAVDDTTVEFTFNKTLGIGEFEDVMMECAIVTQAAYEASDDQMATDPVSTSAYTVTNYTVGSSLTLEDKGTYWQTDETLVYDTSKHNVKKVVFSIVTEASQHTVAMQTGTIDISNGVPDTDISKFQSGGELSSGNSVAVVLNNLTYNLQYNMSSDSIFQTDENLRLAIAYAIDKAGLNEGAFNGNGAAVKDFANANYPDYITDWNDEDYYDYDLEKAQDYVDQSDYDGQELTLMYVSTSKADTLAQMIQAYLSQIGITVKLQGLDNMTEQTQQYDSTAYDILMEQAGSTNYIVNQWKLVWYTPDFEELTGGTANFVVDSELDELMEAALNEDTHSTDTVDAVHDYLVEKCYGFGMVQDPINIVHSNYITGVALDSRNQVLPGACTYAE